MLPPNQGRAQRMAIKEEERQEFAGTQVDNGPASTDVNVRTGMTNSDFDLFQKKDVSGEQEFRDDLYSAIKRGDVERVKELTGWTRDATRPDDTVVPALAKETQENADRKEAEDKRLQAQANQNSQELTSPGDEQPADPLLAFMKDPFGLGGASTQKGPESYGGDSLEEAIRRGDWSAAARIMNAVRAREENEHQDFSGDGYIAGGQGNSMDSAYYNQPGAGWGAEYTDSNGNFQPWAESSDGSVKSIDGTHYDSTSNEIKLRNGQTYESPSGEPLDATTSREAVKTEATLAALNANIDPHTGKPLDPSKPTGTPATIASGTAANVDTAVSVNAEQKDRKESVASLSVSELAEQQRFHQRVTAEIRDLPEAERKAAWHTIQKGTEAERAALYTKILGADVYAAHKQTLDDLSWERKHGTLSNDKLAEITAGHKPAESVPVPAADTTGTAVAGAAVTTGGAYDWAKDEWFYKDTKGQDGYGYADSFGNYWVPDGGHYDENGYTDKNGGYTWDNTAANGTLAGGYQDRDGNYVDKSGNLFLAGNYSETPDRLAAEAPNGGKWKDILDASAAKNETFTLPAKPDAATTVAPSTVASTVTPTVNTVPGVPAAGTSMQSAPDNVSNFMGSLTSFLTTSEVNKAVNTYTQSNYFDMTSPITGSSSVWGTKFFDPANISLATPAVTAADPVMTIAPTNPYYKPATTAATSAF